MNLGADQIRRELAKRDEARRLALIAEAKKRGIVKPNQVIELIKPPIARNCPGSFYQFVEGLRLNGLKVDNYPFKWEGFEYLDQIYRDIEYTGQENEEGLSLTMMCGAQVAKSVTAFLSCIHLPLYFWGRYFGYYLPDQEMANNFSAERYKPMVRGIPEVKPLWGVDPTSDDDEAKLTDKKGVRSIGPSKVIFSYMGGKTSTEGWPLLGVCFDEARRMLDAEIELVRERMSHSPYPIEMMFSTAGFPGINIDKAYQASNQHKFHSRCRCPHGVILSEVFPECIGENTGTAPWMRGLPEHFFICPTCGTVINNPRDGWWEKHNPSSKKKGYHIPQTLSSAQSAHKIFLAFRDARNITEFYNSKLGIPHLPKDAQIVTETILKATINPDIKWLRTGRNFSMGIDQMGGFNVVTVRCWGAKDPILGTCKSRLVHLEMIYADDPWERCCEMMHQFDISVCVADAVPNFNEARRFAQKFPGRVFLSEYNYLPEEGDDDICEWGDRPKKTASQKKASEETINRHRVRVNRYLAIEWNLMKYVNRLKEQPSERTLEAEWRDDLGKPKTGLICQDVFWLHLQKVARVKETNEETGKTKMNFVNLGLDPHFLHADLYAELALSRVPLDDRPRAFGDFAAEQNKTLGKGEHDWQQQQNPQHWRCEVCGVTVRVLKGDTAQAVAERKGWGECKGEAQ